MLLRSSSTPILGSLLSSSSSHFFSDSPISHHHHPIPVSCHLSPAISDSPDPSSSSFLRRARSDGNLPSLLPDDSTPSLKSSSGRRSNPTLETIPSFSLYNSTPLDEDQARELEEQDETTPLSFLDDSQSLAAAPPLFLARGLGIDRLGSGLLTAGGDFCGGNGGDGKGGGGCLVDTGNGGDKSDIEMYYKKMVEENPSDALFMRNYAQFLHQVKGDTQRAEEYYSRAILADPSDGETLSNYASIVWERHRDEERACSYFEQAVQASPQNSHVLAAYAGFLWETDGNDETEDGDGNQIQNFTKFTAHQFGELTSAAG